MTNDGKKIYEVSFTLKSGNDPIITHVAAHDIVEAKDLIQTKYQPLKILEVFPI